MIETTGRTSGVARRVPVGNGLRGEQFWIVTEHGYGADYVKNLQHQPRMRIKVGRDWHHGTAQILPDATRSPACAGCSGPSTTYCCC